MKAERIEQILAYINSHEFSANEDMAHALNIPLTTLRRNLNILYDEGKIIRVHGGAKPAKRRAVAEMRLTEKLNENLSAKLMIAQKAVNCIKNDETLYIDAGSTTYQMLDMLDPTLNLKIYTNSLIHAQKLSDRGMRDINLLPGKLKATTGALCGVQTIEAIKKYRFDVSFIGINAIDENFTFYTTDDDEAMIKKTVIDHSTLSFGLADISKYDSVALVEFSNVKEITLINEEN